jgi:NADH-quinone oxidoreductase subunit L
MVKAGVYLIARLFTLLGPLVTLIPFWLSSLAWIGAITALAGATLALYTPDIKGVPAYSTISQIGFMMAALGAATVAYSQGWFASLFHLISHAFFQGLGFLAIGGIIHALGTRDMRLMGGLRKTMPLTFILCIVVLFARTGVPPFASFFSKGLIVDSLWSTGDILLVLTIYAALAVTFAYTLRFTILVFLRKPSEFIKQQHIHEPPKTMLFSAGILAVLCFVWGFLANSIATFLHSDVEIGLSEVFSPLTLIFLVALLAGGVPVYLYYYRPKLIGGIARQFAPLNIVFEHGYFFDDFYEKVVAGGVMRVTKALESVETTILTRLPYLVANGVNKIAQGTHKYLDILVDNMLRTAAKKTSAHSSKVGETNSESLQRSVAAAILGFLIILIIVTVTVGWLS